jgi:hypothetical protein
MLRGSKGELCTCCIVRRVRKLINGEYVTALIGDERVRACECVARTVRRAPAAGKHT